VTIVQIVPISSSEEDYILTPKDLLSGRESFMIVRQLYNRVTNNRNMESKVIVSYKNKNNRYNAMKNNLKKTVLSVIDHLKISSKKFLHILASDIEWTYVSNDPLPSSTTTNVKEISEVEFDEYLDGIEEKYAILTLQILQKKQNTRQNINLCTSNNKWSNNKTISLNFVDIISQVQKETFSVKMAYTGQS
ncbi:630_t:CDS:2, partial [Gigaspora margarita]